MSQTPTDPANTQHSDILALFLETNEEHGLSAALTKDLLDFATILVRENKSLRSQIESDNAYRTELEVEKFNLQIELHEKEQNRP